MAWDTVNTRCEPWKYVTYLDYGLGYLAHFVSDDGLDAYQTLLTLGDGRTENVDSILSGYS